MINEKDINVITELIVVSQKTNPDHQILVKPHSG